ncbi:MAG: hypothetical protein IJK60_06370 [Clostridia bacterium]|nr:hypothetical protein [Clostridia bacterium]
MKKILLIISVISILSLSVCVPVFAAQTNGSISVEMVNKADKKPLSGKAVYAVKVADGSYENGNTSFTLTDDFASTGVDLNATNAADTLSAAAKSAGISGQKATSDTDGKAVLSNLSLGAYLVYSPDNLFNPFIAFIPLDDGDSLAFDVKAEPKIDIPVEEETTTGQEPVTGQEETTTELVTGKGGSGGSLIVGPVSPGSQSGGGSSYTPKAHIDAPDMSGKKTENAEKTTPEKLPQTGMLQYPVPILGIAGMILFAAGFVIYGEGKRKQRNS